MLTVMEAIQKRRRIRKFKPDPVPDELINQILEAARLAPSATNGQPGRLGAESDGIRLWRIRRIDGEMKNIVAAEIVANHLPVPAGLGCPNQAGADLKRV